MTNVNCYKAEMMLLRYNKIFLFRQEERIREVAENNVFSVLVVILI